MEIIGKVISESCAALCTQQSLGRGLYWPVLVCFPCTGLLSSLVAGGTEFTGTPYLALGFFPSEPYRCKEIE